MTFNEFKYTRPVIEDIKKEYNRLSTIIASDTSTEKEAIDALYEAFEISDQVDTMLELVGIRYSINTKDTFYEEENAFLDENSPFLQEIQQALIKTVLNSPNIDALKEEFGDYVFEKYALSLKTFSKDIIPLLQKENKLSTSYSKLLASAEIEFDGQTYNLSQMSPFMQNKDREVRHKAQLAVSGWFAGVEDQIDDIYDEMVQVRTEMAHTLGYDDYVQLGYDRLGRTDYTEKDVERYRQQIREDIVPYVTSLVDRKAKRIGIEDPKSYDLALSFLSGNPTPKGDSKWALNHAKTMYEEMSAETGEFINFMIDKDLLSLDSIPGKQGGGYCTYIPNYKAPFIFANFNGTSHDVDVLTHEAGHAFQVFSSRNHIPELRWPGYEGAEIHSMSMEFIAYPWIDKFFENDTEKYKFSHMAGALSFLPYGVLVDHFQHEIYHNPTMSKEERKSTWKRLEAIYRPHLDYGDDDFLNRGNWWFKQGHIFGAPFYYIDYTLAQVVAFEFYKKSIEDHDKTVKEYIELCKLGGTKPFTGLLDAMALGKPFELGTVKNNASPLIEYLDSVNDTLL